MVPSTQKALLVTAVGNPVQLVNKHPVPEPGPDEVLLKVSL
jgi:NADPH2:quinone reductase